MSKEVRALIRPPNESDWPSILELANLAVEHVADAPVQTEWLERRRAFEGCQRHFVAERRGQVIGYAAVERGSGEPEATYRVFVVTSWSDALAVAELLYERVSGELVNLGARQAWLREYSSDDRLIEFFRARGFEIRDEYEHEGKALVTLIKDLDRSAPTA